MTPSLDMLILSFVAEGVSTPYQWLTQAGLSLGGSLPAVRRLLARGLVSEAATGPRGRREFTITRAGRKELKNIDQYLHDAMLEPVADLESVLRVFSMAVHARQPEIAVRLLKDAASECDRKAIRAQKRASISSGQAGPASLYLSCTAQCEADRLHAWAASLRSLVSQLGKVRSDKSPFRRNTIKLTR